MSKANLECCWAEMTRETGGGTPGYQIRRPKKSELIIFFFPGQVKKNLRIFELHFLHAISQLLFQ